MTRGTNSLDKTAALTDDALVKACLAGHEDAWETLIRRFRRLIYSIAITYRLSESNADDAFQRVAFKLIENLAKLRKAESLAGWIGTVTRHECQAILRESRRESVPLDDAPEPSTPAAEIDDRLLAVEREHAVALALDRLGEPCQSLLRALYCEQPTPAYDEISRRLGRPIGSLGPTRARCLNKLRAIYGDLGGPALDG